MHSTNPVASNPKKPKPRKKAEPEFFCGFCKKEFKSERTLMTHMCVKKGRELEKDDKNVRMGLRVYARFFELVQRSKKSWDDFLQSQYYNDFVKVGRHIIDTNPVNTPQFIDFLCTSTRPVKEWCTQAMYETYIRELTKRESPDAAVERNILLMQQWATATENHWTDFFRLVAPSQATLWIKTGRISPWVVYICESSDALLNRMSPEQFTMIQTALDPDFWKLKMDKYQEDVDFFRKTFREVGL